MSDIFLDAMPNAACFPLLVEEVRKAVASELPSDGFTPELRDVLASQHPDRAKVQARAVVASALLTKSLSPEQADRIRHGIMRDMVTMTMNIICDWRSQAKAAHAACQELLGAPDRREAPEPRPVSDDDQLCVACLDELRSVVYRPCGHRVCCETCATSLWTRSQTCPWCRRAVEEV